MPFSITVPAFTVLAAATRRVLSPHRLGRLALSLTIGLSASFALSTSVLADDAVGPADSAAAHDTLVQQLIQQQHAAPLVADCAAHAAFVVPTSPIYDHVEFLPSAVDAQHASVEPWNQPFDDGKQRITVDTLVLVSGLGYRKGAGQSQDPDLLKFRCGYVADKLLAFSYNEPFVYVKPHYEGGGSSRRSAHGHHAVAGNRHGARAVHGRATAGHHATHATHASHTTTHKSPAKHRSTQ